MMAQAPAATPDVIAGYLQTLSAMSGRPVTTVAMHNPSVYDDRDPFEGYPGIVNTYDGRFTRDVTYVSDSCGAWRDSGVQVLSAAALPPHLHVLVHPLFWGERHRDRWQCMTDLIAQRQQEAAAWGRTYTGMWRHHAGVREHDARA
jgi:hypothetical protein